MYRRFCPSSLYLWCVFTRDCSEALHVEASLLLLSDSEPPRSARPPRQQVNHLDREEGGGNEQGETKKKRKKERKATAGAFLFCYLLIVDFQHTEKDLRRHEEQRHSEVSRPTHESGQCSRALHLTLSALLVLSDGLKQPLAEFRNQAFVGPVANHRVTLP